MLTTFTTQTRAKNACEELITEGCNDKEGTTSCSESDSEATTRTSDERQGSCRATTSGGAAEVTTYCKAISTGVADEFTITK